MTKLDLTGPKNDEWWQGAKVARVAYLKKEQQRITEAIRRLNALSIKRRRNRSDPSHLTKKGLRAELAEVIQELNELDPVHRSKRR